MRGGFHLGGERVMVSHIPHPEKIHHGHHDSENGHRNDDKRHRRVDVPQHWTKAPIEGYKEREDKEQERSPLRNPILWLIIRTLEQVVPHALPPPDTEQSENEGENHPNDYVWNHG